MANQIDSPWTDEAIETLKRLRAAGHGSTYIANILGLTRNAVVGKAYRLRVPAKLRTAVRVPRARGLQNNESKARMPSQRRLRPQIQHSIEPLRINIQDLHKHHCRYPLERDGNEPVMYCGHNVVTGESWCPHHYHAVFLLGRPR